MPIQIYRIPKKIRVMLFATFLSFIKSPFFASLLGFGIGIFTLTSVQAQVKLPTSFEAQLLSAQLDFYTPADRRYKRTRVPGNSILNCDFSMKKRRGDLEIRFLILQDTETAPIMAPQVQAISTLSTVATNDSSAVLTVHRMDTLQLQQNFKADWGMVGFFRPKRSFSRKAHGKMISLYAAGKGQVFIFLLFNQIPENLEQEQYALSFH